ncbi:MAG TPA: sensor histidine kinase [Bacillaceae bacterium]
MIKAYFAERRSWILFFLFWQGLMVFVSYLDTAIPMTPILYMAFLSLILFAVFLAVRYQKESTFYRSLSEWESHLDLANVAMPESPFEDIIENSISEQTNKLKKEAALHQLTLEQEKDDLLSWIHEVKTPLTAMHLMIERLEDETLKAGLTYEWLRIHLLLDQQLHQKRMAFIENDLLIEKTDLKTLVFNEIKTLQSWCIQKGIGFDIDLQETEVLSDAKWLAFILRQLLTNAVKYSDASDIVILSKRQDGHVILEIQDSGRGIGAKDMPRIFDKGFTSTTHHDQAATGMGLYLAKRAAGPLLIKISVDSVPGEGTCFTLTFPKRNEFVGIAGM